MTIFTTRLAGGLIQLDCEAESHSIGVEKAVPLGLIVNELVTNAAKHAFWDKGYGRIAVSFSELGNSYRLQVSDDGIGYDPNGRSAGLGQGLLKLLASQLGSNLKRLDLDGHNRKCRHSEACWFGQSTYCDAQRHVPSELVVKHNFDQRPPSEECRQ